MENTSWIVFSLIFTFVSCSTITRFKDPLPMCDENIVCSKINALSYLTEERHYFSYVTCQCPSGQKCPKAPGKQTILVEEGLWYGLCTPISEMRPCIPGETAEKLHVDMDRKTNIQINCICPAHELELLDRGESATEWVRASKQSGLTIHELMCGSSGSTEMEKRKGRGFRKFYFYKK
ncbi:unnamed protein product [Mytilus coruscus]|uniref:Uncharacterized protein n=1 Tax=Mytilus coruscus TaxID=42192 RepID=A0A6J8AK40_MYTCO|nr:unnamed protein product [Mytilus coruscus]